MMWPAFVIALCVGFLVGYLFRKVFMSDGALNTVDLQRELSDSHKELEQARATQKLLEQENADLSYQLGEAKKAQAYAEQRNNADQ